MIKNHLSKLLGVRRISQAELARRTGIRPATICEMYNEIAVRWNEDHIDRICEVLSCQVGDLLEYMPNTTRKRGQVLIIESHGNRKYRQKEPMKVFFATYTQTFCNLREKLRLQM